MDSFSKKTKSRKVKRPAKKSHVQIILDLFSRAMEIIVVLVTVAKLCFQLVNTFEDSGFATVILANRNLAFVVGNAIIIALIAKSGLILNQEVDLKCKSSDLYEEFVRESSRRDGISRTETRNRVKQSEPENKAKQNMPETRTKQSEEEKENQSITENIAKQSISEKTEKLTKQRISVKEEEQSIVEHQDITVKKMEKQNLEGLEKSSCGRLKRSETDAFTERFYSDDELRFKIESFIARQRRNQNDD